MAKLSQSPKAVLKDLKNGLTKSDITERRGLTTHAVNQILVTERQSTVSKLYNVKGKTMSYIAEQLGVSRRTVGRDLDFVATA